ncbi:hypothetical protein [Parabacteroides chongii]|uniref:hypothetical protein n=1 Tax=Parabacteroides chongii TaxID=2685834 RepID=UPI00240E08CF|nr:hypothetical protein [Parabacteroides chongii]WFE84704.1 hypothetical protein P3L47_21690 [Parabacteroides chongii]
MSTNGKLPRKWGYIFALTALAALGTCIAALIYKEYIIALATGLVFGAQVFNFIKWKRQ